jgi:hypothetical protein
MSAFYRSGIPYRIAICVMAFALMTASGVHGENATGPGSPRVTCDMQGTDLRTLAKSLTARTGVRFRVGYDIADEKLDVFVKEYPLADLQRNIARIFGYQWSSKRLDDGTVSEFSLAIPASAANRSDCAPCWPKLTRLTNPRRSRACAKCWQ